MPTKLQLMNALVVGMVLVDILLTGVFQFQRHRASTTTTHKEAARETPASSQTDAVSLLRQNQEITSEVFVNISGGQPAKWDFAGGTNTMQNWPRWRPVASSTSPSRIVPTAPNDIAQTIFLLLRTNQVDGPQPLDLPPIVATQRSDP